MAATFDDVSAVIPQARDLLVGVTFDEVLLELLAFHQIDDTKINLADIHTSFNEFFEHDCHFPAVGCWRGPELHHGGYLWVLFEMSVRKTSIRCPNDSRLRPMRESTRNPCSKLAVRAAS